VIWPVAGQVSLLLGLIQNIVCMLCDELLRFMVRSYIDFRVIYVNNHTLYVNYDEGCGTNSFKDDARIMGPVAGLGLTFKG